MKFKIPARVAAEPKPTTSTKFRLPAPKSTPAPAAPPPPKRRSVKPLAGNLSAAAETQAMSKAKAPSDTEVTMYDYTTPGRSALQVTCAHRGMHYGIITVHQSFGPPGSNQTKTKAIVLVGRIFQTDYVEGDLDDALFSLSETIEGEVEVTDDWAEALRAKASGP